MTGRPASRQGCREWQRVSPWVRLTSRSDWANLRSACCLPAEFVFMTVIITFLAALSKWSDKPGTPRLRVLLGTRSHLCYNAVYVPARGHAAGAAPGGVFPLGHEVRPWWQIAPAVGALLRGGRGAGYRGRHPWAHCAAAAPGDVSATAAGPDQERRGPGLLTERAPTVPRSVSCRESWPCS